MTGVGVRSRGGYRPDGRLEALGDEIVMELVEGLRGPANSRQSAFREVVRLGRKYVALLGQLNAMQPMGFV